jgi:hypothetical protein
MSVIISPVAGTRVEPKDSYYFVRGTTATFKVMFINEGLPVTLDSGSLPVAQILEPLFLGTGNVTPNVLATLTGSLVEGQTYEYQFVWDIPRTIVPVDEYIISYQGRFAGMLQVFGDEYFGIGVDAGQIDIKTPSYATVDDVRKKKFNIDDYLPQSIRADLIARNNLIEVHLRDASNRLREELSLFKQRGMTENNKLFCIYYAIWSLLLAARGEDGSAVSDSNINFWRAEWERILAQEKRKSVMQGMPLGRG